MSTQRKFSSSCAKILSILTIALLFSTHTKANLEPEIDIRELATNADFIFKGKVTNIAYRHSESVPRIDPSTGQQALDEDGQPIFEDGSDMPHTFVTFLIEQAYKGSIEGSPTSSYLTLQFAGGLSQTDSNSFLMASSYPLFDVNDRDFLFVERNTVKPCPLVQGALGRFRIIVDTNDPTQPYKIYDEFGYEVTLVPDNPPEPNFVTLGPFHELEEANTHVMGTHLLRKVVVNPINESGLPSEIIRKGSQFTEDEFENYIIQIVQETCSPNTPSECAPPIVSADITQPFFAVSFADDPPPTGYDPDQEKNEVIEYPRPWLDLLPPEDKEAILEAERIERQLFELTGGDPVLPETPCEISILMYGRMPGDISGPQGKPDCRVNFFDVGALADNWLECTDPNDPECI